MNLLQFFQDFGIPISNLTVEEIKQVMEDGVISKRQAEKLLSELKETDNLWQTAIPMTQCSPSLW